MKLFITLIIGIVAGVTLGWVLWADHSEYTTPTHDTAYIQQYYADHGIK